MRYFTSELDRRSCKGVQMEDGPLEGAITWTFGTTPRPMMPLIRLSTPTAHAHSLYSPLPPTEPQINQYAAEKESELKECLTQSWVMTNQAICLVTCLSAFDIVNSSGTDGGGGARSFAFILSLKTATTFYRLHKCSLEKVTATFRPFFRESRICRNAINKMHGLQFSKWLLIE